ncbi:hypothetical protein B566_EDAN009299 [Ephemera danica]|nr:hypothetical protein B566_EDAN009299 [Ephemera danica]
MALSFTRLVQQIRLVNKNSSTSYLLQPAVLSCMQQSFIKVELPDFDEDRRRKDMTPEEIRSKMKEKGVLPPRPWSERPFTVACTGGMFEPYVPPEGDGKISAVTVKGAKQKLELLEKKSKSMMAVRKIRSFDEDFESRQVKAARLRHRTSLSKRAYPEMRHNMLCKTLRWKFLGSLEAARVVHARCTDIITKENIFAQVTVRLHTQQSLCIWDRFGRLQFGSEDAVRDVLEYVVFEKHIANQYGRWRLHDKILPEWLPVKEPSSRTFIAKPSPPPEIVEEVPAETDKQTAAVAPA